MVSGGLYVIRGERYEVAQEKERLLEVVRSDRGLEAL